MKFSTENVTLINSFTIKIEKLLILKLINNLLNLYCIFISDDQVLLTIIKISNLIQENLIL